MTRTVEDEAAFMAEQAVKRHYEGASELVPWFHLDSGAAVQVRTPELLAAYRAALVEAYREVVAPQFDYAERQRYNDKLRREEAERQRVDMVKYQRNLEERYRRSAQALEVVEAAARGGKKTVRVADVLAARDLAGGVSS